MEAGMPLPGADDLDEEATATEQFMAVVDQAARSKEAGAPKYAVKAWFILDREAFPRKQCIWLVEQAWFDHSILVLIGLNCLTMMWFNEPVLKMMLEGEGTKATLEQSPSWAATRWVLGSFKSPDGVCDITAPGPCSVASWIDLVFLVIFAIEMVIKMLAQGLMMHPNSYLRQGWNWLDFLVVIIGFIEMFTAGLPGISTLRLIKTLRPLRSLQRIRGMRVLVQCILEAMPQMCNVLVFLVFIIIIFGLLGCALFKGSLRHTCHVYDGGEWVSTEQICNPGCEWDETTVTLIGGACDSLGPLTKQKESYAQPGFWTYSCRAGQECRCSDSGLADPTCSYRANPNYGITSFDSLPWAMVSLFQAISLEGWVDMMYQLMDGNSSWVWFYFIVLVLFGAIIVINLFLAVLCDNFEMADRDGDEKVKEESGEEATQAAIATLSHSNKFRQMCLNLVKNKYFDWFVQGCILFNTLVMMLKYSPQPIASSRVDCIATVTDSKWDYLPQGTFWAMTVINIVLTGIFTFESTVKVFALGPVLYARDWMNLFDAFVVLFSIVEIVLDLLKKLSTAEFSLPIPLSILRAFRIFRLFKLVRSIESMRKIISTLATSLLSVIYLLALLGLIVLIFILLGMDLFGGFYPRPELNYTADHFPTLFSSTPDGKYITWDEDWPSRYHFDDIGNAFLAIFVVLSGENWNEIMFNSHRATWDHDINQPLPLPFAIPYFLGLFVIGNLLLFNLFIAILLSNFDDDEEEEEEADDEDNILAPAGDKDEVPGAARVGKIAAKKEEQMMTWQFNQYMPYGPGSAAKSGDSARKTTSTSESPLDEEEEEHKPQPLFPLSNEEGLNDRSCGIFTWTNPVRIMCCKIITHWLFESVVITLILVSTGLLLFDFPQLKSTSTFKQVMVVFNVVFAIIFAMEMIIKMIAMGIVKSKTPKEFVLGPCYFASVWNWLDFVIVLISILTLLPGLGSAKPLRALRALRPLRLVSRYEDLKITVKTLVASVPAMGSLILVAFLFFIIFAILGLELYGGRLGYCMDPLYDDLPFGSRVVPGVKEIGRKSIYDGASVPQTDYEECMALPRYNLTRHTSDGILISDMADIDPSRPWLDFVEFPQWMYPQFGNFDHMMTSLLLLFEISALEGWPDVMHVAMDSDGENAFVVPWRLAHFDDTGLGGVGAPMESHVPQSGITSLFFILWIFLGCFVVVNMTIGVVVDCFSQIKAENDGLLLMSEDAADWVKAQKQVFATRPLKQDAPPAAPWRLNVYYVVTSTKFELAVMAVIMCNMLQMGCDFHEPFHRYPSEDLTKPEPNAPGIQNVKAVMSNINIAFLVIYIIEMIVKWIGLGVFNYFKNPWDCFDFFLVMISTVEVIITSLDTASKGLPFPPTIIRVLRLFRVVRILRVIKTAKQLRTIIMTVYISLPQLTNIGILISLLILIFDILAVNFFSNVNYTPGNYDTDGTRNASEANGEFYFDGDYFWSDDGTNWGDMINRHANFQYFWTGMLALVRSSTGESFNGIMHDAFDYTWGHNRMTCCFECGPIVDKPPVTVVNPRTGATVVRAFGVPEDSCGSSFPAVFIYLAFQMIMAYIVLSIMIGVILENFANVGSETRRIGMDDLEEFREVWLKYDPKGTFIVPSHNLLAILQQLKQPLGIAGSTPALTRAEMLKHLGKLDIPDHGGYIHFMETLTAVANHHAGVPVPVCDTTKKMQKAALRVPHLSRLDKPAHNALTNYLVSLLQSRWRGYAMRKKYDGDEGGVPTAGGVTLTGAEQPQQKFKSSQVVPEPQQ